MSIVRVKSRKLWVCLQCIFTANASLEVQILAIGERHRDIAASELQPVPEFNALGIRAVWKIFGLSVVGHNEYPLGYG